MEGQASSSLKSKYLSQPSYIPLHGEAKLKSIKKKQKYFVVEL